MASATAISSGQDLETSYSPDRDYVEGEPMERNVGTFRALPYTDTASSAVSEL